MSSITLTPRGQVVKVVFIMICLAIAMYGAIVFVSWLSGVVYQNTTPSSHICVQDTVMQPDGSCTPQEHS